MLAPTDKRDAERRPQAEGVSELMDLQGQTILITGASGSVGQQIIYELAKQGIRVVAHVREGSDTTFIDSLGLEKRLADLRNRPELDQLVAGVDAIIHAAAWVDFRKDKLTQFTGINTFGAVYLYHAAAKARVKRFVHISSVAAIGGRPRGNGKNVPIVAASLNEQWPFNLADVKIPYLMTKWAAEEELLKLAAAGGPELVIVNPSIILSPSTTRDDRGRGRRRINGIVMPDFPNLMNLVDLRDLAPGVIAALRKGRPNERYILGGDNMTARELVLAVSVFVGKSPHLLWLPNWVYRGLARIGYALTVILGRSRIRMYPELTKLLDYDWAFSSSKARQELGYTTRSIHTTLGDLFTNNFVGTYMRPDPGASTVTKSPSAAPR